MWARNFSQTGHLAPQLLKSGLKILISPFPVRSHFSSLERNYIYDAAKESVSVWIISSDTLSIAFYEENWMQQHLLMTLLAKLHSKVPLKSFILFIFILTDLKGGMKIFNVLNLITVKSLMKTLDRSQVKTGVLVSWRQRCHCVSRTMLVYLFYGIKLWAFDFWVVSVSTKSRWLCPVAVCKICLWI